MSTNPPKDDDDAVGEDESLTSSTDARWTYLGSTLAILIIAVFLIMVGAGVFGVASLTAIPSNWFYVLALLVLTAGGWTFGADLVDTYRNK